MIMVLEAFKWLYVVHLRIWQAVWLRILVRFMDGTNLDISGDDMIAIEVGRDRDSIRFYRMQCRKNSGSTSRFLKFVSKTLDVRSISCNYLDVSIVPSRSVCPVIHALNSENYFTYKIKSWLSQSFLCFWKVVSRFVFDQGGPNAHGRFSLVPSQRQVCLSMSVVRGHGKRFRIFLASYLFSMEGEAVDNRRAICVFVVASQLRGDGSFCMALRVTPVVTFEAGRLICGILELVNFFTNAQRVDVIMISRVE